MAAIDSLIKILGKQQVLTDQEVLKSFAADCSFVAGKLPACVVRPRNAEEVQRIVLLANQKGLTLVPCSSGGPRTRGDTVPLVKDTVVVDLGGMDAIVRVDRRNKVALVEPGVTFGALQGAAAKEGLRVSMPLAPRKTKSVVASLLEREPTTIPKFHWDMSDPLCCLELFFGTGERFRTGGAAGPGTLEEQWASGQAQKSPMGPSQADWAKIIQGSQGTMGVVTWASLKLELKPQVEKAFFVGSQSLKDLVAFTYAILRPRLPDLCFIVNHTDLSATLGERSSKDLCPWVLFYSISGCEHFPEERVAYLEADIRDIAQAAGLQSSGALNGVTAQRFLSLASAPSGEPYWKDRVSGGFQDIFFLTTLDRAPGFVEAMEAVAGRHGFPPESLGVYIQPVHQGRACHVEFTLLYNPEAPGETRKVRELFLDASQLMMDRGGFFSRPYGPWAELAYRRCLDSAAALRKVKAIVDPRGVMNPGKLCFGQEINASRRSALCMRGQRIPENSASDERYKP